MTVRSINSFLSGTCCFVGVVAVATLAVAVKVITYDSCKEVLKQTVTNCEKKCPHIFDLFDTRSWVRALLAPPCCSLEKAALKSCENNLQLWTITAIGCASLAIISLGIGIFAYNRGHR